MRIKPDVVVSTAKKNFTKMSRVVFTLSRMSWKIIQVRLYNVSDVMKSEGHCTLEGSADIFETERELLISKGTPRTDESSLVLISGSNIDLVVTRKPSIKEYISLPAHSSII